MARNISLLKTRETYNRMYGWGNSVSGQASGAHSDSSTVLNSLKGKEGQFGARISGVKPCLFLPDFEWVCHFGPCVCDTEPMMRNRAEIRSMWVFAAHHTVKPPHQPLQRPQREKEGLWLWTVGRFEDDLCRLTHVWASADERWGLYFYFLDCLKWGRT